MKYIICGALYLLACLFAWALVRGGTMPDKTFHKEDEL